MCHLLASVGNGIERISVISTQEGFRRWARSESVRFVRPRPKSTDIARLAFLNFTTNDPSRYPASPGALPPAVDGYLE